MALDTLNRRITILNLLSLIALAALLGMIFLFAPTELNMGNVHRLLYFHVGIAWVAALAFLIALGYGVLYLRRRDRKWDTLSMISVEVGLVFFTITIAVGSVWARAAWNTWWVWSPRLTLVVVMWLVYIAYFMLRGAVEDPEKRGRFAAVYVAAAFVTVLLTYASIRIFRDIHPTVVGGTLESAQGAAQGESDFSSGIESARMGITLAFACGVFTLIYVTWLANRYRLELLADEVENLKARLLGYSHV